MNDLMNTGLIVMPKNWQISPLLLKHTTYKKSFQFWSSFHVAKHCLMLSHKIRV